MFDLEIFLYGFCYFDAIPTKAIERGLRGCFANSLLSRTSILLLLQHKMDFRR